jgi:voltage-gated potassium channel
MGIVTNWTIFRKFYIVGFTMIAIILFGIGGFMLIEKWSFFDSFYMTVITITTVGFGEVHKLSSNGRLFTVILILSTFGTFTYLISLVTSLIASGELGKNLKIYRNLKLMSGMKNHVIVCGLGRVGNQVVKDLIADGFNVVAIESNLDRTVQENVILINGDATNDEILEKAGINNARTIVACLPNDTDNLFVVLSAREKNKSLQIISRASQKSSIDKMKYAGANHVIMPDSIGGSHMASIVSAPVVIDFLDQIRIDKHDGANIESISFEELPMIYQDKTLEELNIKKQTGATVIGFRLKSGEFIINPADSTVIEEHSSLLVLGNATEIENVNKLFNLTTKK